MNLSSIFLIIFLFATTAFASATEMAIASISRFRLKAKSENGDAKAKSILKLVEDYDRTITSIVILNNIANILLPTITTIVFISVVGPIWGPIVSTVVMTLLILLIGEIIPKIYGKENAEAHLYAVEPIVRFIVFIVYPLSALFLILSNKLKKLLDRDEEEESIVEEEILTMIEESKEDGQLLETEEELIRNAIEFNDTRVEEILQGKSNMVMVNVRDSLEYILDIFKEERFSRMPVYGENSDDIIGVISEREFLVAYIDNPKFDLHEIIRPTEFVPDTMKISALLTHLQAKHNHMAIVVDERATICGLVTVEDIIEELVGDIWDEHDDVVKGFRKITDDVYEFSGEFSIQDFNEIFEVKDIESETQEATIAGYIIELAQRIPDISDEFEDDIFKYIIVHKAGNKIEKIKVIKKGECNEKK